MRDIEETYPASVSRYPLSFSRIAKTRLFSQCFVERIKRDFDERWKEEDEKDGKTVFPGTKTIFLFFSLINTPPVSRDKHKLGETFFLEKELKGGIIYTRFGRIEFTLTSVRTFDLFPIPASINSFERWRQRLARAQRRGRKEEEEEGRRSPNKPRAVLATRRIRINQMKFRLY